MKVVELLVFVLWLVSGVLVITAAILLLVGGRLRRGSGTAAAAPLLSCAQIQEAAAPSAAPSALAWPASLCSPSPWSCC